MPTSPPADTAQARVPVAAEPVAPGPIAPGLVYHCACGQEFLVNMEQSSQCPLCMRTVTPEAIRNAKNATVSLQDLDAHEQHLFDLGAGEPEDLLSHKVFGHFRLERRLGGGGMGAVYRALDMSLQRYVAVKVIHQRDQGTDLKLKAILREAVAQARLNHPNVVTIYYVGRQDEEPFLAMELLPGPTLGERLRAEGTIPYGEAIRAGIQVASALKHASFFDIVHADIKPANLIMAGDGRIKLSDFGLSRIRTSDDANSSISGTPAYVAPELIDGEGMSIQSDMYALGITLFELVFGRPPFELQGETIREKLQSHRDAVIEFPTPWPASVPREFRGVIERLMAKSPKDRYPDYDALLSDLKAIEPVSTTPAGYATRAVAYLVDQIMLLLAISPFAAAIFAINQWSGASRSTVQLMIPVVAFASLIVPAIYLLMIYRGWSSLGRYLFQLRIVEEHGLPPRREQLVPREVLRNAFAWCFPLSLYVTLISETFEQAKNVEVLAQAIEVVLILFLSMNTITLFLLRGRKALHDYLCHSQVVLAVNKQ